MAAMRPLVCRCTKTVATDRTTIMPPSTSSTPSTSSPFCPSLQHFSDGYKQIHDYLSLVICLFGTVANILNIMVLTRRKMKSPTNALLTGLAVAHLLITLEYIPFVCHMYLWQNTEGIHSDDYSYASAIYLLFHANFNQVFHTVSMLLTIILAVWRYIAVVHPQRNREWCSMRNTKLVICIAYIVGTLLCIPNFLAFSLHLKNATADNGNTTQKYDNVELMVRINLWVYDGVLIKLIPCVAITVLILRLVRALVEIERRRQLITARGRGRIECTRSSIVLKKERTANRTTRMLLAILILFLITEIPQGILGLLSGWFGCYHNVGGMMDILGLLNSPVIFILYCATSSRFRSNIMALFCHPILDRPLPDPQLNGNDDNNVCTNCNNMNHVTRF